MTGGPRGCHTKGTQDKRPMNEQLSADCLALLAALEEGLDTEALAFDADDEMDGEA